VWRMSSELSHNLNDELPDGRPVKRFYALQDFFLGYLHPDWILDDRQPTRFLSDSPRRGQRPSLKFSMKFLNSAHWTSRTRHCERIFLSATTSDTIHQATA
jgi:hypothetical protein